MTEVEAIERILKGGAFRACTHCDGTGNTPASRQRYEDAQLLHEQSTPRTRTQIPQPKDFMQLCMRCKGVGLSVEETYIEACQVLGREPPKPTMDYGNLVKSMQKKAGEIVRDHMRDYLIYGNAFIPVNEPKDPNDDR